MTVDEIAQLLLSEFDGGEDGMLSLAEAQTIYPALTQSEFGEIDLDNNGFLTESEIEAFLAGTPEGCCNTSKSVVDLRDYLGDLFLLGLALFALMGWNRMVRP